MKEPMLWNTLEEAAEWLSEQTNSEWDARKISSFSIEHYRDENKDKKEKLLYTIKDGRRRLKKLHFDNNDLAITCLPPSPTYLSVLFSRGVRSGIYQYEKDIETINPEHRVIPGGLSRVSEAELQTAPLYLKELKELFLYRNAEITLPYIRFLEKLGRWEYGLFEPLKELTEDEIKNLNGLARSCHGYLKHEEIASIGGKYRVYSDMLGIHKVNLKKLLNDYRFIEKSIKESEQKKESLIQTDNLKTALVCMAIDKYDYDLDSKKSDVTAKITDLLSRHGMDINERTVRGWLADGKSLYRNKLN